MGIPTVFVRLTGCPLRCVYCDTAYAFSGGELMQLEEILDRVASYNCRYVTVTGGEPLAQRECLNLLKALGDGGYQVSLETGGAMPVEEVDPRVCIVMDLKTPASRESHRNRYENLKLLRSTDQVKFVICNREDYEWSAEQVRKHGLVEQIDDVLFSPSHEELDPAQLAQWILDDRLSVRMQIQLHKVLWKSEPGR